jgi:coenzyme F420-reducing hydrogenase alpha subunit
VRIRETIESVKILRQLLDQMPGGPVMAEFDEIPPYKVGVSSVEAPRGEVHHYAMTGPDNRPYRWRVRAPTYNNLQVIPSMLRGQRIADAPISVGSLDPCFSCTERMAVIDRDSGAVKVYKQEELLEMFNKDVIARSPERSVTKSKGDEAIPSTEEIASVAALPRNDNGQRG